MNGIIITKLTTEYNPELMSIKQDSCDTDMISITEKRIYINICRIMCGTAVIYLNLLIFVFIFIYKHL